MFMISESDFIFNRDAQAEYIPLSKPRIENSKFQPENIRDEASPLAVLELAFTCTKSIQQTRAKYYELLSRLSYHTAFKRIGLFGLSLSAAYGAITLDNPIKALSWAVIYAPVLGYNWYKQRQEQTEINRITAKPDLYSNQTLRDSIAAESLARRNYKQSILRTAA